MEQQQFRGDGTRQPLTRERLADLIGLIYDCTLDPTLWPEAIRAVGDATNCFAGMLVITDLERSEVRSAHSWNHDPIWLARLPAHAEEIAQLQNEFLARSHGLGEPSAPSREIAEPYESR